MVNRYLMREDAPLEAAVWDILDRTMAEAAKSVLTGRRLLHIEGPYGFGLKGVPLQDCEGEGGIISSPVLPLQMVQTTFSMGKRDLAAFERDGLYLNVEGVALAAMECARMEDALVFQGPNGQEGLVTMEDTGSFRLSSWNTVGKAADDIIQAVTSLDQAGFHGPYCLALPPSRYNLLFRRYPQGGTELEHVQQMVTGGIIKAPPLDAGGVLMASGKQFASIILGEDMQVGFIGPVGENLEFTISETLALLVKEPGAICVLKDK
ncbi:MAG: bacteriocin family protein [Methanomicrobiales archaeon]|nr:bacteriocin family protein [Methanomicrobiales archaeon]